MGLADIAPGSAFAFAATGSADAIFATGEPGPIFATGEPGAILMGMDVLLGDTALFTLFMSSSWLTLLALV